MKFQTVVYGSWEQIGSNPCMNKRQEGKSKAREKGQDWDLRLVILGEKRKAGSLPVVPVSRNGVNPADHKTGVSCLRLHGEHLTHRLPQAPSLLLLGQWDLGTQSTFKISHISIQGSLRVDNIPVFSTEPNKEMASLLRIEKNVSIEGLTWVLNTMRSWSWQKKKFRTLERNSQAPRQNKKSTFPTPNTSKHPKLVT